LAERQQRASRDLPHLLQNHLPTLKKLHSFPDTYAARLGGTDLAHPNPVTRILAILIKLSGFQEE
jgi:hypothetical protein